MCLSPFGSAVGRRTHACDSPQVSGLACDTEYEFQVRELCEDANANSAVSNETAIGRTLKLGACLEPAGTPSNLTLTDPASDSVSVTWVGGSANDCVWAVWGVQVQPANRATWSDAEGCQDLPSRTLTWCTAVGLQSNTGHRFRVREVCLDSATDSEWLESAEEVSTLLVRSQLPLESLRISGVTTDSVALAWDLPELNDCEFLGYYVRQELADAAFGWQRVEGSCEGHLMNQCSPSCTVTGPAADTRAKK